MPDRSQAMETNQNSENQASKGIRNGVSYKALSVEWKSQQRFLMEVF